MIYFLIALFLACFLVILIIIIISLLDKLFKTEIIKDLSSINFRSQYPLILLSSFGFLMFFTVMILRSHTFKTLINEIAPTNGNGGMGQFGDFFNGVLTPFLTLVTILFLYRAFKEQFKANELFYNFEIEKVFKEDIDWLRSNSKDLIKLESTIEKFISDKEIKEYLDSGNTILLRKSLYFISMFKKLFKKFELKINDLKVNNNESLTNLNEDLIEILMIYYMPSFKQIFRDFNNYFNNISDLSKLETTGLDIKYMIEFSSFYKMVKDYDENYNLFKGQLFQFDNKLKNI